jgi:hypothetical protein
MARRRNAVARTAAPHERTRWKQHGRGARDATVRAAAQLCERLAYVIDLHECKAPWKDSSSAARIS